MIWDVTIASCTVCGVFMAMSVVVVVTVSVGSIVRMMVSVVVIVSTTMLLEINRQKVGIYLRERGRVHRDQVRNRGALIVTSARGSMRTLT